MPLLSVEICSLDLTRSTGHSSPSDLLREDSFFPEFLRALLDVGVRHEGAQNDQDEEETPVEGLAEQGQHHCGQIVWSDQHLGLVIVMVTAKPTPSVMVGFCLEMLLSSWNLILPSRRSKEFWL
jgi:hypothetical protein